MNQLLINFYFEFESGLDKKSLHACGCKFNYILKKYYIECGSEANLFSLYMNFAFW